MREHRGKTVIGLLIAAALLWWALRDVSAAAVLSEVRQANLWWLAAAVAMATASFLLRAIRWRLLLLPTCPTASFRGRFSAVSIGFMVNNLLPARLGEFARAFSLSRVEPIGVSAAFASLVVERVFDGLVLALFLFIALASPGFPVGSGEDGSLIRHTATIGAVLFGIGLLALWLLVRFPAMALTAVEATIGRLLPPHLTRRGIKILASFIEGLGVLHSPRIFARAMAWSIVLWLWLSASIWCGLLAFRVESPGAIGSMFVQGLIGFAVAIPSSPGFFGPFEAAARLGLTPYGVATDRIISFATTYHISTFLPITLIGLYYVRKLGLTWAEVGHSEEIVESAVEHADEPVASADPPVAPAGPPVAHADAGLERSNSAEPLRARASSADRRSISEIVRRRAHAKINLRLRVFEPDADGFHAIETIFLRLDLSDDIELRAGEPGAGIELVIETDGVPSSAVPVGTDNIVWRAADRFFAQAALEPDVTIRLVKRIAVGAGLGGGSADAGATLGALNDMYGRPLAAERLDRIGAELGSDVPFSLLPEPMALGWERGRALLPLAAPPPRPVLVLIPDTPVATADAYAWLDADRNAGKLTRPPATTLPAVDRLGEWETLAELAINDFEAPVFCRQPRLADWKRALFDSGARPALLCGSGSGLFGVFSDRARRDAAGSELDGVSGVQLLSTTTCAGLTGR